MDWVYSDKVRDHFQNPRNILDDEDAYTDDGKGYVGNPQCGDMMLVAIKVDEKTNRILECKWKTYGCASAVASTSQLSEMVVGKTLDEAYRIKPADIMRELGGLPEHKIHCSVLGDKAMRDAIDDYYKRTGQDEKVTKPSDLIVCNCLQVTEQDIRDAVNDGVSTFEELQNRTKVATGCGKCKQEAKVIFEELLEERH